MKKLINIQTVLIIAIFIVCESLIYTFISDYYDNTQTIIVMLLILSIFITITLAIKYKNIVKTFQESLQKEQQKTSEIVQLNNQVKEYQSIVNNAPNPYIIMDNYYNIISFNKKAHEVFHLDKEKTESFITFVSEPSKEEFLHHLETKEYKEHDFSIGMNTKDSCNYRFRINIENHSTHSDWYVISLVDINKELSLINTLNQTNILLKQEYERFELAIAGSQSGIFDWDITNDTIYYSPRWKEILGYQNNELENKFVTWESLTHPEDLTNTQSQIKDYLENPIGIFDITFRMHHKNGNWIWINARGKANKDEISNTIRMIGFNTDVTELIIYQNELEEKVNTQLEQLRQKDEQIFENAKMVSLGEMIGNIAHQWRQPLSHITVFTTGLLYKHELGMLKDEELIKGLESVNDTAQHLSKTIDTFKNFAKKNKEKSKFLLQNKIEKSLTLIDSSFKQNHIEVHKTIPDDEMYILAVEGELLEVLLNIYNNAIDALTLNKVEEPMIHISLTTHNDTHAIICIEDNGGGIPEHIIPRIFEPYFTTKHQSQGTGLGLNMSFKIITESMGGQIYAKNSKDGAQFFIELPLLKEEVNS